MGEGLKSRLQIRFIDQHGLEEAGIDGGGLFKEFMECLVKEGFDPNAGLFQATSDNRLYPNPAAQALVPNALAYFEFLGRMLGKAMYEVRPSFLCQKENRKAETAPFGADLTRSPIVCWAAQSFLGHSTVGAPVNSLVQFMVTGAWQGCM